MEVHVDILNMISGERKRGRERGRKRGRRRESERVDSTSGVYKKTWGFSGPHEKYFYQKKVAANN